MFGIFKKKTAKMMDSKRTTDECLEVWAAIGERDRTKCAENILRISRAMRDGYQTSRDATLMLGRYKQEIIKEYNLKNHMHPAFMQVQILMDLLYTDKRPEAEHFDYTLRAFKEITGRLTAVEKQELQINLTKFIQSNRFSLTSAEPNISLADAESETDNLGWPDIVTDNFTSIRRVCDLCGAHVNIPRYAPRPNREGHNYPPLLRRGNYVPAPPINDADIIRFNDAELSRLLDSPATWLKHGDKWDPWEIQALLEIGHACSHGSRASTRSEAAIEEEPYLERPIDVHQYMTKYGVNQKDVEQAVLKGRVKAELIDDRLWLEDRPIK